jgi:hypothetical protein
MALPNEDEDAEYSGSFGQSQAAIGAGNAERDAAASGIPAAVAIDNAQQGVAVGGAQAGGQAAHDAENAIYSGADSVIHGIQDAWGGMKSALSDTFSAEQVSGPEKGQWGTPGTVASGYNQAAVQQGLDRNASMTAQGQAIGQQMGQTSNSLLGQAGAAGNRAAPATNWAGADRYASQADSSRNLANKLVNQAGQSAGQDLQLQALNQFAQSGPGPSQAQAQLLAAQDANDRSALSLARSGRGAGDSASALRDAAFSNAQSQAQTGQSMAQLRAQEQAAFRQQQLQALESAMGGAGQIRSADATAAQLAQGTRSQDLQAQGQAADQAKFNTQTQQNQTSMNDALKLGLQNNALGFASEGNATNLGFQNLGQQAEIDYAQLGQNALNSQADYELQQQQMTLDAAKANQQADLEKDSGITGLASSAAGALFALSDERAKDLEDKESALADALETVGNAPGYSYRYKDPSQPGAKGGRMVGPMAQDIERGPLGDSIIADTPQGKMVDEGRLEMVNTSAITELNHKVKALEAALGKRAA